MDSINMSRSYTEYTVTEPTTDFAIGFDNYSEGDKDIIHVTLDGVAIDTLGYTILRVNDQTLQVSPAIAEGTVRLQRETGIDTAFNTFTSGALFSPEAMDNNFAQVRHSQQEVRDDFIYIQENTLSVTAAARVATENAITATEAANATTAAVTAATTAANTATANANTATATVGAAVSNANAATASATTAATNATTATSAASAATTTANTASTNATAATTAATTATANAVAATGTITAAVQRVDTAVATVEDYVLGTVKTENLEDGAVTSAKLGSNLVLTGTPKIPTVYSGTTTSAPNVSVSTDGTLKRSTYSYGTAATRNVGTAAGNLVERDANGYPTNNNALGVGQTWQDVTASRSMSTTYTNTTGKPIQVLIQVPNSTSYLTVRVGGLSIQSGSTGTTGGSSTISFVVPIGGTYGSTTGQNFTTWLELK